MNKKVLAIVGGGCLLVLLCAVCLVGVFIFGSSQMTQLAAQLGAPGVLGDTSSAPDLSTIGKPTTLPPPTAGASQPAAPTKPSTSSGNPFADALSKAKGAQKYRVEYSMVIGSTQQGQYKESPFISFAGEIDGNNSHITSKAGLLSTMLTGSEKGSLELIEAGGTEYMKGASSLFGAIKLDPNTWYISNQSTASSFAEFAKPDQFSSYSGGANFSDFRKVRSESVDGQSCDVYLYDMKSIQNQAMVSLLGSAQDKSSFSAIDKAEVNFWMCGDGYVHKFMLDYTGHNDKNPADKGAFKMNWHIWDINNPTIVIQAPKDAKPMPTK